MENTDSSPHEIQPRRRWSAEAKAAIVHETLQAGATLTSVARRHGIAPSQLFQWRKAMEQGALVAVSKGEKVVSSKLYADALAEIRQLQRVLGKATLENEVLKEMVKVGQEKKWISRGPLPTQGDSQ